MADACFSFGNFLGTNPQIFIDAGCVEAPNPPVLLQVLATECTVDKPREVANGNRSLMIQSISNCPTPGGSSLTIIGLNLLEDTVLLQRGSCGLVLVCASLVFVVALCGFFVFESESVQLPSRRGHPTNTFTRTSVSLS